MPLIKANAKVGGSEATLLAKLGIKPFEYGLVPVQVYDNGSVYDPKVLDITDEDLETSVGAAIGNIVAVSLATGYPTLPAMPHIVVNAFKNVVAVCLETDYSFPLAAKIKEMIENPEAFMVAAAPAAGGEAAVARGIDAIDEAEEEEEASDSDMGMDLFG